MAAPAPALARRPRRPARPGPRLRLRAVVHHHAKAENGSGETDYLVVITLVSALYGYVHWMVTRWRFEGDTLRIETGLIRQGLRAACRWPASRRSTSSAPCSPGSSASPSCGSAWPGSGSTDGRLAYLSEARRPSCAARPAWRGHREADAGRSPSNTGCPMATVHHRAAARLGPPVAGQHRPDRHRGRPRRARPVRPEDGRGGGGFLAVYLLSFAGVVWRRLSGQYALRGRRRLPKACASAAACCRRSPRRSPTAGSRRCARWSPCCGGPSGGAAWRSTSPGPAPQPAGRGHRRGAQGAAAGGLPAGRLAPARPAARRAPRPL